MLSGLFNRILMSITHHSRATMLTGITICMGTIRVSHPAMLIKVSPKAPTPIKANPKLPTTTEAKLSLHTTIKACHHLRPHILTNHNPFPSKSKTTVNHTTNLAQIILIQQQMIQTCPACGFAGSFARSSAGCVTFSWCICLFILTGVFCCWVPFCIDSCYDVQIVCSRCGFVKGQI